MTSTQGAYLTYIGVLIAIIAGLGALYYQKKSNDREAQKAVDDHEADAVKAAQEYGAREINIVKDQLTAMAGERDYWRSRCNQFEDRSTGRKTESDQ